VDAHYWSTGGATAALLVAADLRFATVAAERLTQLTKVAAYRPGHFAVRELPAIRAVLTGVGRIDLLIVDGYVQGRQDATVRTNR
jgi:deoxyinosine 3'endonuclease (endonuclease V)